MSQYKLACYRNFGDEIDLVVDVSPGVLVLLTPVIWIVYRDYHLQRDIQGDVVGESPAGLDVLETGRVGSDVGLLGFEYCEG